MKTPYMPAIQYGTALYPFIEPFFNTTLSDTVKSFMVNPPIVS